MADKLREELTARRRGAASPGRFIDEVAGLDETFLELSEGLWLELADTITIKKKGS